MEIEAGKYYSFKLNSGEEIIAKVASSVANYYMLSSPVSVAPGPQGLGLIPSFFTSEAKLVKLYLHSVAMEAELEEEIKAKYVEATGGIYVPPKKLILG